MKNFMILGPIMILASLLSIGCEDAEELRPNVDLEFRLLNKEGQPSTSFKENKVITFSFLVTNLSEEELYLKSFSGMDDFFRVYQLQPNPETGDLVSIGKPYNAIFCQFVNGYIVPSKGTLKVELPWIPRLADQESYSPILCNYNYNNQPLLKGSYTTGFTSDLSFSNGAETFNLKNQSFEINFKIQ